MTVVAGLGAGLGSSGAALAAGDRVFQVPPNGVFAITGHGWGHGHGLSQYGAYGAAKDKGLSYQQILAFYYPGTTPTGLPLGSTIRVLLHGAMAGGFLIEAGKFVDDAISPLISRIELSSDWRFALFWPRGEQGLAGQAELQAFERLPPTPATATQALCQQALLELAPAAAEQDFDRFSESLYRFGRTAGQCFSAEQGGSYASPRIAQLVDRLRSLDIRGAGQSSWGPAVFALTADVQRAQELVAQIAGEAPDLESLVAAPANCGVRADPS